MLNGKAVADAKLFEERVTLRTIPAALCIFIVSIALLYVGSQSSWWTGGAVWQTLLQQIGSALFTLAVLTLLWELFAKRAFLDEMLAKTRIAKDLLYSGVAQITDSFHEEVDWVGLFRDASKIDIFFAYGATWRRRHDQKLKDFVGREKSRLRIVLPDPREPRTMADLAQRFNLTEAALIGNVREAEEFFLSLSRYCLVA